MGATVEAQPAARAPVGEWVRQCRAWVGIWKALIYGSDQGAGGQSPPGTLVLSPSPLPLITPEGCKTPIQSSLQH